MGPPQEYTLANKKKNFENRFRNGREIRLITFGLACILCFAVCFGLLVATVAGIAYGYNYSMAEFITFTRSDVTVFMRRGQFQDDPDVGFRRSGDSEDLFSGNSRTDYEDLKPPVESKPLGDTWLKTQDTRKYAEMLTRYNPSKEVRESDVVEPKTLQESPSQTEDFQILMKPTPVPDIKSVSNALMPTVSWRGTSSKIMMRNFQPLQEYTTMNKHTGRSETFYPTRTTETPGTQNISILKPKKHLKSYGDGKIHDDYHEKYVPMRVWGTTTRRVITDEPEDVDDDNIVYKPV